MTKAMQYINENFLSENFTLKEQEEFLNITKFKHYKYLIKNTYNKTNLHYNIKKSKSIEGRIMSKADKKSALKELKNIESFLALITGKNNSIIK